jgi:Secretion system C-terminal sorting domain
MKIISSFALLLTGLNLCAQVPQIVWQKSFGGSLTDTATAAKQTTDGGYIITGFATTGNETNNGDITGNNGNYDYWVVKLDASGTLQWQKSVGGSLVEYARDVQQTPDGGYIIAGYTQSNDGDVTENKGYFDYWIVKLNESGIIEWEKTFGGPDDDIALSMQITSDNGYILAGYTYSASGDIETNYGDRDSWVVKLDPSGTMEWQKTYGGTSAEAFFSIQQTSDGGYIAVGGANSNDGDLTQNNGDSDYWVVKLDATGVIQWQKALGGTDIDLATSVKQTSDNGYMVAGYTKSGDGDIEGFHGISDFWILKFDPSGNILWKKTLGGSDTDEPKSICQTNDGNYLVAGYTSSNDGDVSENHGQSDYWLVKLDNSGTIIWQKTYGGTNVDQCYSAGQNSDGSYVLSGASNSDDVDVSENNGDYDYWILKLTNEAMSKNQFELTQNQLYPNPFNDFLNIKSDQPINTVTIYNLTGNIVLSSTSNALLTNTLSTGTYIVKIETNQGITYHKIIKT